MRNPARLPLQAITSAIVARLEGQITRVDGSTIVPIYSGFPIDYKDWDFIKVAGYDFTEERIGLYTGTVNLNVFSTYTGTKELSSELEQIHSFLVTPLDMDAFEFTDSSVGGELVGVSATEQEMGEGVVIQVGAYRRRWKVSDQNA